MTGLLGILFCCRNPNRVAFGTFSCGMGPYSDSGEICLWALWGVSSGYNIRVLELL